MTPTAYSVHPTPIGEALVVVSDEGLVALHILDTPAGDHLAALTIELGAVPEHDPAATAAVTAALEGYFAGIRRSFDLAIDWRLVHGFTRTTLQTVCEIPYGETTSYGDVAVAAGHPRAHRAVGSACARTPISIVIPAHRVVRADGSIGEYGGHPHAKRLLLDLEARAVAGDAAEGAVAGDAAEGAVAGDAGERAAADAAPSAAAGDGPRKAAGV
ncbi:methylated-DNA--[protein]-cysteine S-methyltransferase [Microbacterium sp. zg.Y1090]|uniref:methylated-DNA--[protein]-cysteine S-methyltransferase n=1 Tax=Microbacterium TaxID=33882 RepID=UPI00214AD17E|nr:MULTISPECIES: methylated-DNA--[protein]-cysteine S-methyltransferase [unclassified Microbacterium]MCR2812954.1 methylated-DNA--[protein]-cysteine S-methyltransferase [Microbacterium sp. zg.Y1084]MCR2817237.1 methylated-DNA--[protein]-cysteine S-methyltransferase [Microbacterium sp. zg.Y1090]MDL5486095.1 methylated-DNA--[protein]-cysteine S-methyltransferase [Microbacterium sp. zg-Y1211]WIM29273.1 methylated-DNA--[protein]-cysteine S-methyltransferase [Microbacterium sp. zg-Y1090]